MLEEKALTVRSEPQSKPQEYLPEALQREIGS